MGEDAIAVPSARIAINVANEVRGYILQCWRGKKTFTISRESAG
jgi:hypothetical protein